MILAHYAGIMYPPIMLNYAGMFDGDLLINVSRHAIMNASMQNINV